jgi:hypothetical protein
MNAVDTNVVVVVVVVVGFPRTHTHTNITYAHLIYIIIYIIYESIMTGCDDRKNKIYINTKIPSEGSVIKIYCSIYIYSSTVFCFFFFYGPI